MDGFFMVAAHFIPNNPLARYSGEGRNPARKIPREADKISALPNY
ncbi:MAG: hypothetical protein WAW10_01695 [Gallionella sp.]